MKQTRFLPMAFFSAAFAVSAYADTDPGFFGVCEHVSRRNAAGGEYENRCTAFAHAAGAGFTWMRTDFDWSTCEPSQGNWNWTLFDNIMADAEAHGIQILPILCYGCSYSGHNANGSRFVPDDDLPNWLLYATNVVTRYRGRISAVEVWNEEDLSGFWSGTVAQYAKLLKATYAAVKAVAPEVKVVLGGISAANPCDQYLSTLYSNGVKGYFDVAAIHPYVHPNSPDYTWTSGGSSQGYIPWIQRCRSLMDSKGDSSKPIWITEVGWPTHTDGVDEATQASYLTRTLEIARYRGIEKVFLYELKAPERSATDGESHFGIVHADFSPKPAYTALRSYVWNALNNGADPYASHMWLTAEDSSATRSFAAAGHWSDGASPSSGKDYLVDLTESTALWTPAGAATFAGRSLTIGRAGGPGGGVRQCDAGSAATIANLVLNGGSWAATASGCSLAGAATVASPSSAPFRFLAESGARSFTLASALSGTSGSALRFEAGSGATLDAALAGDASAYAGSFIAEGSDVTLRLADVALRGPSGAGAVALRSRAALAPAANGQRLAGTARAIASDGTGRIDVPSGQSFTLAAPISGTFRKTGAGTLVLDPALSGNGTVAVESGVVEVTPATAGRISAVTGGRVLMRLPDGALSSVGSTTLLSVPGSLPAGSVVLSDGSVARGWSATVRIVGGTATADVSAMPRTTMGSDSFETYAVGADEDSLPGWTGEGAVAAGTPTTGDPPGVPLSGETHTRILALDGDGVATRTYSDAFARDNQSLDFLLQVERQACDDWQTVLAADGVLQLRLAFDPDGAPWILHGDSATGAPVWTRLGHSAAPGGNPGGEVVFGQGQWLRVSIDVDYTTSALAAYAQVRLDGSCMLAPSGARTPGGAPTGGSWFRLPAAAVSAKKISAVKFQGSCVDDVVLAYHAPSLAPDFPMGAVTASDGIPFAWFDSLGIPREAAGDPDADGLNNLAEWSAGTDPLDAASHPDRPMTLIVL